MNLSRDSLGRFLSQKSIPRVESGRPLIKNKKHAKVLNVAIVAESASVLQKPGVGRRFYASSADDSGYVADASLADWCMPVSADPAQCYNMSESAIAD